MLSDYHTMFCIVELWFFFILVMLTANNLCKYIDVCMAAKIFSRLTWCDHSTTTGSSKIFVFDRHLLIDTSLILNIVSRIRQPVNFFSFYVYTYIE